MSYAGFSKLLVVPDGFEAPRVLTHGDLRATPLSRECLADDVRAINADRDLINATRGGGSQFFSMWVVGSQPPSN